MDLYVQETEKRMICLEHSEQDREQHMVRWENLTGNRAYGTL